MEWKGSDCMRNEKTRELTFMAVFAALAMVATLAVRIPMPATQGYIHPGDALVILSAWMIGRYKGAFAGALGQAMADLLGGYAVFAPVTLIAKLLMGIIMYRAARSYARKSHASGIPWLILSALCMAGCYYLAETFLYGSLTVPLVEIPANLIQFAVGAALATAAAGVLVRSPAKSYFSICRD